MVRNLMMILSLMAATVGACASGESAATQALLPPAVAAGRLEFEVEVGPLLASKCGDSACHGRPQRPFTLFATGARRQDPIETHLKTALKPTEVNANYAATLGFIDSLQPRHTTLLKKSVGLLGHGGGPTFEAFSDPAPRAIAAWLTGMEAP